MSKILKSTLINKKNYSHVLELFSIKSIKENKQKTNRKKDSCGKVLTRFFFLRTRFCPKEINSSDKTASKSVLIAGPNVILNLNTCLK